MKPNYRRQLHGGPVFRRKKIRRGNLSSLRDIDNILQGIIFTKDGTVFLKYDAKPILRRVLTDVLLLAITSLIGIFIGSILFSRLQKSISGPISAIVENMQIVSETEAELRMKSGELTKTSENLEHALKAEKRFIATMSHEMRTPLNAIIGLVEVMLTTILDEYQVNLLTTVRVSSGHLLALISDVLDASKIESGQMALFLEPLDLKKLLLECVALIEPRLQDGAKLCHRLPDLEFWVMGDAVRIKQIFLNILGNAVKFTECGEIRFLLLKHEDLSPSKVEITFSIEDSGTGIPEAQLENLFQPFRQLNSSREGTGLGLYICHSLIKMMGGKIAIANRDHGGLRVLLSLTFQKVREDAQREKNLAPAPEIESGYKDLEVLIVEDVEVNIVVARELLVRFFGITRVDFARNGLEGVEKVKTNRFDIILMDIQMPVMDGIAATQAIRQAGVLVPIIAMSANALLDDIEMAKKAGVNEYLPKPIEKEKFSAVLKTLFGQVSDFAGKVPVSTAPARPGAPRNAIFDFFIGMFQDAPTAEELAQASMASIAECLPEIRKAWTEKDLSALRRNLHKMKGILLTGGLKDLAEIATQTGQRAKEATPDFAVMDGELQQLETRLKTFS